MYTHSITIRFLTVLFFSLFLWHENWAIEEGKGILKKHYEEPDHQEIRQYQDVILDCGHEGKALFTISLPQKIPSEGLPCIVIVGGLMTGRESLRFIPDHGNYALIAYEYSDTLKKLRKLNVLWNLFSVRKAVLEVPPQLIAIVKYLQKQSWMGSQPIDFMGYSFGSIFIPVTYVKTEREEIHLGPAVMAYGGAGIHCLIKANIRVPTFLKKPISTMAAALFKPVDPLLYAPDMKGEFLIINGTQDTQIPLQCAKRLQDIIPEPKTVMNLETEHMSPENTELTLRLIEISRGWLRDHANR
jgi:hypothetical protein